MENPIAERREASDGQPIVCDLVAMACGKLGQFGVDRVALVGDVGCQDTSPLGQ